MTGQYQIIFVLVLVSILLPLILQTVVAPVTLNGTPINPPYCDFNDPTININLQDPNCANQSPGAPQTPSMTTCQQINFASTDCSNLQLSVNNGKATCGAGAFAGGLAGAAIGAMSGTPIIAVVGAFGGFLTGAGVGCGVLPAASPQTVNTVGSAINSIPVVGDVSKAIDFLAGLMKDFMTFMVDTASYELALAGQIPAIGAIILVIQIMTFIMLAYTGLRLGRGGG